MTELVAFDFPVADVTALQPETALDELETTTQATGNAILTRVLQAQSDMIDATLVEQHRQHFSPAVVHSDGAETVTVASRFGTLELAGQVCYHPAMQTHIMPGNRVLPPHHGIIITRGLHLLGLFAAPGAVVCSRGPSARLANARGACAVRYHGPQPRAHPWADHPPGRARGSRRTAPPR